MFAHGDDQCSNLIFFRRSLRAFGWQKKLPRLNACAEGIGELLGVSLFASIWLVLISILLLRSSHWPNWLGYFGLIVAASLHLNLLEIIGIDMGAIITVSETLQHFWMLATAIVFLRKKT